MSEPILRLSAVQFAYAPARPVLRGAELAVCAGERVALSGPNASGKSTLLHLAVGLVRPSAGTVRAFGRARRQEADFHEVRRRAGLLFQDADDQLFCPTVAEDVAFGPLNLGQSPDEARATTARTLDRLGLAGYEDRVTYRLSGGEKRLVSLAAVLAMDPDLLLLDEPESGLDEAALDRVQRLLTDLPQGMIVVSQNRDFRAAVATRAVRLREGRIEPMDLTSA